MKYMMCLVFMGLISVQTAGEQTGSEVLLPDSYFVSPFIAEVYRFEVKHKMIYPVVPKKRVMIVKR